MINFTVNKGFSKVNNLSLTKLVICSITLKRVLSKNDGLLPTMGYIHTGDKDRLGDTYLP